MACCGRTCAVQFNNVAVSEAYISDLSDEGEAVDVTKFGDGAAGSTIVCKDTATITVNSYADPAVSVGDDISFNCQVCGNTYSSNTCEVVSKTSHFEATGVPYWTTNVRIGDSVSGF